MAVQADPIQQHHFLQHSYAPLPTEAIIRFLGDSCGGTLPQNFLESRLS